MLSQSFIRFASPFARHVRDGGARACLASLVKGCSSSQFSSGVVISSALRRSRPPNVLLSSPSSSSSSSLPQLGTSMMKSSWASGRFFSSGSPSDDLKDEESIDVTPVGTKPWQITAEAIAEAEAAEDIGDEGIMMEEDYDINAGDPSEWQFDESTEEGSEAAARRRIENSKGHPPTPILDAYERSRNSDEMERLIKMAFDSLPERAGPQRYNHKRREIQRFKTIRKIKLKEKTQRMAAHERKLQKTRDRKARDLALFATWRGKENSATVMNAKQ